MTYIELINRFWQVDEQACLSGNETRLYFYLLKVANTLGWPDEFDRSDGKTEGDTGLSKNTMKSARLRLVEVGFLDFEEGGKGQGNKVRYQLRYQNLTPKTVVRCQKSCQKLTPTLTVNESLVSEKLSKIDTNTIYKRNKTLSLSINANEEELNGEVSTTDLPAGLPSSTPSSAPPPSSPELAKPQKAKLSREPPPEADLPNPFGPELPALADAWNLWMQFRREKKKKSYVPIGLRAVVTGLMKLSGNDEQNAVDIINQSITRNWDGFFPVRRDDSATNFNRNRNQATQQDLAQFGSELDRIFEEQERA